MISDYLSGRTYKEEDKGEGKAEHEWASQVGIVHDVTIWFPYWVEHCQRFLQDMRKVDSKFYPSAPPHVSASAVDSPSIKLGSPSNPPVPKASHHLPSPDIIPPIRPFIFIFPLAYPAPEDGPAPMFPSSEAREPG